MYCSFCGKEIPDESTFCGYCGKKLVYIGDRPDFEEDGWIPDDDGGAPYFVAPHWNFYGAASLWDEEDVEEARPEEGAEGAASEDAASDDAVRNANADAEERAEAADDAAAETDAEAAQSQEGIDAEEAVEDDAADEVFEEDFVEADLGPGPVLPATQPLSKEAFRNAASSGVYVPARAGSGQQGKGRVAAPAVVGIAVAALLVGAVGAFALADPLMESLGLKQVPATEAPADNPSEQDGANGDEAPAAGEEAAEGADEGDQGEAQEQEPAVETGFGSAKKLVAALETPLFDALGENFSHTSMRLLAIDELDFMVPAYAEALAREAGYATVSDYARNVEDGDASQFGNYAGTWSFKLERGKKCSARTIERMERQFQLAGVDLTITKAYKIEAVTANYPSDYQSENVDDEGLYHKVTPYTAIQVDGRWYLYTDALVPVASEKEE